jgi:protein SCO1/2
VDLQTPLLDQHGNPTRFGDFHGRAVLVFFGYTHCPDVCPLTLAEFKQVKALLGDAAQRAVVTFVTVDPTRDTPAVVGSFVANFDPDFVGLTGDPAAIDTVTESFNARYRLNNQEDKQQYTVDHTAFSYLLGPRGEVRYLFPLNTSPGLIAQAVRQVLDT